MLSKVLRVIIMLYWVLNKQRPDDDIETMNGSQFRLGLKNVNLLRPHSEKKLLSSKNYEIKVVFLISSFFSALKFISSQTIVVLSQYYYHRTYQFTFLVDDLNI
jgi:hypothetical protein